MKRTAQIIILFCIIGLAVAPGSQAQEPPVVATLQISVWPEFDQLDVLVIYRGWLAADTPLPAPLEIRMPAGVVAPSAVAFVDESGQRLNLDYTTRVEENEQVVSFELPTLGFQLEYYDALPIADTGRRSYTLDYKAHYAVEQLSVEFQVPLMARNFELEPPADSVVTETDGLVYHLVEANPLAQGEARSWTLRYDKDNTDLTFPALQQQQTPAVQPTQAAPAGEDSSTVLIFFVAFVALVAVGATTFWLGRRTAGEGEPTVEAALSARKKRQGMGRATDAYCHKCGTRLRADAEFCHRCGTTVRVADLRQE